MIKRHLALSWLFGVRLCVIAVAGVLAACGGGGGGASGTGTPGTPGAPGGSTAADAPRVFYTDILSGPNTGGEGNNGAYLTIFGKGFGASQGSSQVTINDVPVAAYRRWADGVITVQPGFGVGSGAIKVTVNGKTSNADHPFTVRPGKIFFVALSGTGDTCAAGEIAIPCRHVQEVLDRVDFGAGDHIVIRGGTWTDVNARYNSFFSLQDGKGGTAADPIVVMAYPGETVFVPGARLERGVHAWNSPGGLTVSGLVIDMQGGSGTPFGFPPGVASSFGNVMQNVRAVNNEFTGMVANGGGSAVMDGRGKHFKYFGNRIHDNGITNGVGTSSKLYHGIYFDNNDGTGTDDVEIAYNTIWNQGGGRGIQIYDAGTSGITNVSVHHNVIHDIALDGILFGESTGVGMAAYNNVVYRTAVQAYQTDGVSGGCIRFNNLNTVANIYHNTFVDCAVDGNADSAALRFDNAAQVNLVNNIVDTTGGAGYAVGTNIANMIGQATNNLWNGSGAAPPWDHNAFAQAPGFVGAPTDLHLTATSIAIDHGDASVLTIVSTDLDGTPRPQGTAPDIGAYEYSP